MVWLRNAFVLGVLTACGGNPGVHLDDQVVTAGCGMCLYLKPTNAGCYWVIEHEGETYPVAGKLPLDHENHAHDGMCNMKRQVRVTGDIRGPNFIATKFDVLPTSDIPDTPRYTPDDKH